MRISPLASQTKRPADTDEATDQKVQPRLPHSP